MLTQNLAILLAITGVYASPIVQRDECSDACYKAYNVCRGQANANRATCASEYSGCLGYLPFNSEGSLVTPTACSKTAAATPTSTATADACAQKCSTTYNECRGKPNAHRPTCASEYSACLGYLPFNSEGSLVTPTACSTTAAPTSTGNGIPGGCNPAHPGSCPTSAPAAPAPAPTAAPAAQRGWTVKSLTRYCSEDKKGCDYNFAISTNDGAADQKCTIIRSNQADATTESWYDQDCTSGSSYKISWGFSTQFETPFAVLTAVNTQAKAQAYFGVSNPNGQAVTPSNPFGSGNFGDIGPQPVYTF